MAIDGLCFLYTFIINALMMVQWIMFAPIASESATFYQAPALQIDLLSLISMIIALTVLCIILDLKLKESKLIKTDEI
jgi:hypothetical protein